jgi:hypothetical protein
MQALVRVSLGSRRGLAQRGDGVARAVCNRTYVEDPSRSPPFMRLRWPVQCCLQRKVPTLVIKLDFAKAFDTVNWDGLQTTLAARGFNSLWCSWIQNILQSSKSAVLVNGCLGPWINCKRGLRQGDPLSPYLFLLVAETLQQLIKANQNTVRHPISHDCPCPVLQYADDTLIVMRGDPADICFAQAAARPFC